MSGNLFEEFDAITTEAWREKIQADLKGKPWEKLVWQPEEGIELQPYYRKEELTYSQFGIDSLPGEFPFRRGNPINASGEGWQIVQSIQLDDEEASLARLEESELNEIYAFYLSQWKNGSEVPNLGTLLTAFDLRQQALHVDVPVDPAFLSLDIYGQMKSKKIDRKSLTGTLINDPISKAAAKGKRAELHTIAKIEAGVQNFTPSPWFRGVGLDLSYIHEQGGSMTQQIAFALGTLVEYLDWLELSESNVTKEQLLARIAVTFSLGTNFIMEIAKLRAFRLLYAKVVQAYGIEDVNLQSPFVLVKTDKFHQTQYDYYNNLLRTTTEVISGIIGGANAVIIQGFDRLKQAEDAQAARLARNIQHLLRHESYLDKVIDPAGGSYYIEQATDALGQKAWEIFQQMEAEGGFLEWVEAGKVGEMICKSAGEKINRVQKLKDKIIGVNQSPNTEETIESALEFDGRLANPFEKLRSEGDQYSQEAGRRPLVNLLLFGNVKMRNARSQFARNLLGAGGFAVKEQVIDPAVVDVSTLEGDMYVYCSSNEEALEHIAPLSQKIAAIQAQAIHILAGTPKGWEETGIGHAIFAGMDALEFLQGIWTQIQSKKD